MRRLVPRKPRSRSSLVPSGLSRITLQDYELTRLDLASRTRKQILAALDVWVTAQAEAQAARWLLEGQLERSVDEQKGEEAGKPEGGGETEVSGVRELSGVRRAEEEGNRMPEVRKTLSAGGVKKEGAA